MVFLCGDVADGAITMAASEDVAAAGFAELVATGGDPSDGDAFSCKQSVQSQAEVMNSRLECWQRRLEAIVPTVPSAAWVSAQAAVLKLLEVKSDALLLMK